MSRIAKSARPASSSFGASVDARRLPDLEVDPLVLVEAACEPRIDPGVDGVRREVEHEGRLPRRARFSAVTSPQPAMAASAEDGRQQRGTLRIRAAEDSCAP